MKSLKSNEICHNVAYLIGWGRYALHEDTLIKVQPKVNQFRIKYIVISVKKHKGKPNEMNLPL